MMSPALFREGRALEDILGLIAELLLIKRQDALGMPFKISKDIPGPMIEMMLEAARSARRNGYQTTMVAAAFVPDEDQTLVRVVSVGDSAFFAFGPDGTVLASSLHHEAAKEKKTLPSRTRSGMFRFRPGAELLCKVVGNVSEQPHLAEQAGIKKDSAGKWMVCLPVDLCCVGEDPGGRACKAPTVWLGPEDILLAPYYMVRMAKDSSCRGYGRLRYSRAVKVATQGAPEPLRFSGKGSVTAVLPDHVRSGKWSYLEERFPKEANFVLCSDGFYSAFGGPEEMWKWLDGNRALLHDESRRTELLRQLHQQLHGKCGDDDISLVWVYPNDDACEVLLDQTEEDEDAG